MNNSINRSINKKEVSITNFVLSIISWIITSVWMIEIFRLSSESGEESTLRSMSFLDIISSSFGITILNDTVIRKTAHIFEYAILALLIYISMMFTNKILTSENYQEFSVLLVKSDNELYTMISLWLTFLFAILDEYHQLFIIGRDGNFFDVLIDGIGILLMLLIINLINSIKIYRIRKFT